MLLGAALARATGIDAAAYLSIVSVFALGAAERSSYMHFIALGIIFSAAGLSLLSGDAGISAILPVFYANRPVLIFTFLLSAYEVGSRIPYTKRVAINDLHPGTSISEEIYIEGGMVKREKINPSLWNVFVSHIIGKKKRELRRQTPAGRINRRRPRQDRRLFRRPQRLC